MYPSPLNQVLLCIRTCTHSSLHGYTPQIPVGTTEAKRTTVPFMYNLEERVEGLDVVDFPGVDDRDETIPDLAELLLFLAQVVIFIVDYRLTLYHIHIHCIVLWLLSVLQH